jgi:hypothetical protein
MRGARVQQRSAEKGRLLLTLMWIDTHARTA